MIDIHHHLLPGVDDGPREMDEAVAMCRMAADEGIEAIVATPHVLRGRWRTFPRPELDALLRELRLRVNDIPRLLLGSEYFFAHDMADVLRAGAPIIPLAGSRYVLLELAANAVPPMLEQPLYRAQLEGWVPIIAHPERNLVFQAKPELLAFMVGHGARTQVTAGSLTGAFGPAAQAAAERFLELNLVHFLATDAHNVEKRPPRVQAAIARLRALAGDQVTEALTRGNPLAVAENRGLSWEPEPKEVAPPGFFTRFRSFFRTRKA
ncbi:MAG TPA: CpsB/CapC family capsule biosynthesis tyrosine phosphatase [Thermoanaerobaculia bacterium]|nr:CpsB/CapC family capsule biosynthesis tyrosine phosphatase [Thermoanaerobaculia bacterium]